MYFLPFLAAFLLLKRLRTSLIPTEQFLKWNVILNTSTWIVVALFFVVGKLFSDNVEDGVSVILLIGVVYFIYNEPDFRSFRGYIETSFPLVAVALLCSLIHLIFPEFYKEYEDYFNLAVVASGIWFLAKWANSKKQQEELKIINNRKSELEALVNERTAELMQQKEALQATVNELKATQAQLIQQEKLASLGELTAGIAHEIQNPLNFVNNFSEVSTELLDELKSGPMQQLPETEKEYAEEILNDLTQNLNKITHHGKRADSIVKGMLQHSRVSTGQKELTNINALADEYLRLSYHGLRAKDKTFNAKLQTSFDETIDKVSIIPQDFGRVLLNLFNNAFYSVAQKKKSLNHTFEPTVQVSTRKLPGKVEICVRDNGSGISQEVLDKIFQPFFTTKPTGQGTGLGLSLSYDIITKGHGGEMKLNTQEGEFAEFIISIPSLKEKEILI